MMHSPIRYIRAFFRALKMTLHGENPSSYYSNHYPDLATWIEEGIALYNQSLKIAEEQGLDAATRKKWILRIDRRDISMETILATLYHNLTEEYPRLMALQDDYNLMVIQAINMDDCHRITQLYIHEQLTGTFLQTAIGELRNHLNNIPNPDDQ